MCHSFISGKAGWLPGWEEQVRKRKRLDAKSRKAYVEGLKRYQARGVSVLIDGKEAEEKEWNKIFEIREDGGFYMGDYILEDVPAGESERSEENAGTSEDDGDGGHGRVQETEASYGVRQRLKEIRFDIVYNR